MIAFDAPLDDIAFSLNHVAGAPSLEDYDEELHAEIGHHFGEFAAGVIAPLNAVGDQVGAQLLNGRVRLPDGFKDAYQQYCEQGWAGLTIPEEFGGQGLGGIALGVTTEIFAGANQAFEMTVGLVPGAVRTILGFGTDAQKADALPRLASGEWVSTMALTEPGAGSDLARIKCRATKDDDTWRIEGEKIFISGGDQDVSEGILHLVLARTGEDGISGLSLFLCRSERHDGSRNPITVTRVEEKMGIHASPTCQLRFEGAEAELLGAEGQGLAAMFTMMNHARISVALQGVAHSTRATKIARAYAAERVQGRNMRIEEHPDVARMLDEMELRAMGGRGITHLALVELERGGNDVLVEALTPIAKYFCTEAGSEAADMGIQVLGGYGYLEEYGLTQVLRDCRISRIYEGTNGIHALALSTRLLKMKGPIDALDALVGGVDDIAPMVEQWRVARQSMEKIDDVRPVADVFMRLTAEIVHQFVWSKIAAAADNHADPSRLNRMHKRAQLRWPEVNARFDAEIALLTSGDD